MKLCKLFNSNKVGTGVFPKRQKHFIYHTYAPKVSSFHGVMENS